MSASEREFARPLMTPDEVLRLPFEDALLFIGGLPPSRARKLMYYLDDCLAPRAGLPPPESRAKQRGELLARPCSESEEAVAEAAPPASLSAIPVASKSTEPDDDTPAIPPPPMDPPHRPSSPPRLRRRRLIPNGTSNSGGRSKARRATATLTCRSHPEPHSEKIL